MKEVTIAKTKDVFDLRKAIKTIFTPDLKAYDPDALRVWTPDCTGTELKTMAPLAGVLQPNQDGNLSVYVDVPPLPASPPAKKSFEMLLEDMNIQSDRGVIRRAMFHFAAAVMNAISQQDAILAMDIYVDACKLPGPSTTERLQRVGIHVGELMLSGNPSISTCLKNGVPRVLKIVTSQDHLRQGAALAAGVEFLPTHHLVPFEVVEYKADELSTTTTTTTTDDAAAVASKPIRQCITMPHYSFTLGSAPSPWECPVERLWSEMKVAVHYLHSKGFSHADIKPHNIFIGPNGEFLLGDHGSVAQFGQPTHSTPDYVPSDARGNGGGGGGGSSIQLASAALDWWMLAKTLLEISGVDKRELAGWARPRIKLELQKLGFLEELAVLLEQNKLDERLSRGRIFLVM